MPVRAPLVEAEQDGSIRIQDLAEVVMTRRRLRLAEERLVPADAARNVAHTDDRPRAFHGPHRQTRPPSPSEPGHRSSTPPIRFSRSPGYFAVETRLAQSIETTLQ